MEQVSVETQRYMALSNERNPVIQTPEMSWSNLAQVVYKRTYARKDTGVVENWADTVDRVIDGNCRTVKVGPLERARLRYFMMERKAMPAGRGLWFSGAPAHERIGGAALNNCWFLTGDDWNHLIIAQDLLMLGGGVGMSVEQRFVSKLPKIKKGVKITHKKTADADFIVPDSREGWCELSRKVFEAFFVTGKSFTFSTILIRGKNESIRGFGGKASGPIPLIECIEKLCKVLTAREGKAVRPIDMADFLCIIGEMVVAGNVRRSAIIILGDQWDKTYLMAKRWDLGNIPTWRAMANFSIITDDINDAHPAYWKTYEHGEPFGAVNRTNIQMYGRMGELSPDTAEGVNPCAEACLENGEPCNLFEHFLSRYKTVEEFIEGVRLSTRYVKRVTLENYHHEVSEKVIKRNRRFGIGITGCLQSPLFTPEVLDMAYAAIQDEDRTYSKELGVPESIRTTVVKPSGTLSLLGECTAGIHPAYSRYYIRRVRFSAEDALVPLLREAGHNVEYVEKFDGSLDRNTVVADFYCATPEGTPCADEGWDTWKQLEVLKMAQKHWADQAVSVTVYYKREDIPQIKQWMRENLSQIKTISFLCHDDHGFKQAPLEAISKEQYDKLSSKVKPLDLSVLGQVGEIDSQECSSGACPIK